MEASRFACSQTVMSDAAVCKKTGPCAASVEGDPWGRKSCSRRWPESNAARRQCPIRLASRVREQL